MKIAICDDTRQDLEDLKAMLESFNIPVNIDLYQDSTVLLNRLEYFDPLEYEIYFLDICMPENGIKVAEKIRAINESAYIVFVTTSREYAIDAFKVRAYDYVLKPLNREEVFDTLKRLSDAIAKTNKPNFKLKSKDHNIMNIEIKLITYIESWDRRMIVHFNDKSTITSTSIRTKFTDSIPFDFDKYNFILCHSSYIVNMNYIKLINDFEFVLKNGEAVPISKRLYSQVKEKYIKYLVGE